MEESYRESLTEAEEKDEYDELKAAIFFLGMNYYEGVRKKLGITWDEMRELIREHGLFIL